MFMERLYYQAFLILTIIPGLVWVRSGFAKVSEGKFPGMLGGILEKFASNNPYPFYKSFLQNTAIPNAQTLGNLVMWGELLTGLAIILSVGYLLLRGSKASWVKVLLPAGLIGGLFLNINFFLGGAWTNASKEGLNMIMIMTQAASLFFITRIFRRS